jgi:hypothetical protein
MLILVEEGDCRCRIGAHKQCMLILGSTSQRLRVECSESIDRLGQGNSTTPGNLRGKSERNLDE